MEGENPENRDTVIQEGNSPTSTANFDEKLPSTLQEWTLWLRDKEMPIFSRTARNLNLAIEDGRAGVADIARIILGDPTLTAKLLKLANSPYYNPSRQRLATVTRAVILLGLNIIRELALACTFIDEILSQNDKKQEVYKELAYALHAAVQAKSLATLVNDPHSEEIFIAALLHNIGQIVFWCFGRELGDKIQKTIQEKHLSSDQAEKQVLGFQLDQLSCSLSKIWGLGGLIENAFESGDRRTQFVRLGFRLARASREGWGNAEVTRCIRTAAELVGKSQATP